MYLQALDGDRKVKKALLEATLEPTIKDERNKKDGYPLLLPSLPPFLLSFCLPPLHPSQSKRTKECTLVIKSSSSLVINFPSSEKNSYLFPPETSRDSLYM